MGAVGLERGGGAAVWASWGGRQPSPVPPDGACNVLGAFWALGKAVGSAERKQVAGWLEEENGVESFKTKMGWFSWAARWEWSCEMG